MNYIVSLVYYGASVDASMGTAGDTETKTLESVSLPWKGLSIDVVHGYKREYSIGHFLVVGGSHYSRAGSSIFVCI